MKHYGDITKMNGANVEPVDVVTGGSPCQDLSVAGQRAGLAGERSGLFMEQIRVIKEIREHDRQLRRVPDQYIRPRFMVWENVPGALTSNDGEDFRAVIEETARIVDPGAVIPGSEGGKWTKSGAVLGKGWSIAWRIHNAEFWGVPQRRRRLALVADFGGQAAAEVLFIRRGLSWDPETGEKRRETTAGNIGKDANGTGGRITYRKTGHPTEKGGGQGWEETETADTLNIYDINEQRTPILVLENHPNDSRLKIKKDEVFQALPARMGTGGNNQPMVYERGKIRKLTPLECERLQGFPDNWTNIPDWVDSQGRTHKTSDSARYKALGNSIALPFWFWLLRRISAQYERPATLGSLFDGIGGFPLCWERCNGKGTAIWASEIEDYPIAVTRYHFPDDKEGSK